MGSIWLRIGTGGGLMWTRWWTSGFHKMLVSSRVAAQLAAQEGLSSMSEWVSEWVSRVSSTDKSQLLEVARLDRRCPSTATPEEQSDQPRERHRALQPLLSLTRHFLSYFNDDVSTTYYIFEMMHLEGHGRKLLWHTFSKRDCDKTWVTSFPVLHMKQQS
jgi:hypothetical protein